MFFHGFSFVIKNFLSFCFFASNGKEYPFLLVGKFPKPPVLHKMCVLTDASIPKAGNRVKGKINAHF